MSALLMQGVAKRFGTIEALRDLNLDVQAGEFFALLGPSAAGKTTTLRTIAGLATPDAGTVVFAGQDVTRSPVQGRDISMIFQSFALYPHLSTRDNLAYPLKEARLEAGEIDRRVGETAEMLKISHTLNRKPPTLSGGEQQRVAIGRALIRRPAMLLLDEPLTNLDAKLRHDTRAEFKRLHRELQMTMLYATPDQLEALTMGQRIAVIHEGRIVQTGTPDTLYEAPTDSFVGTLVGAPAMNLIPAVSRGDGGRIQTPFAELDGGPWAAALAAFPANTDLVFGFRPQDVTPAHGDADGPRFDAKVHLTEPLGDITVLDLNAGDTGFKMVLPEEQAVGYSVGDAVTVRIALENTHLFSRETGTAIR